MTVCMRNLLNLYNLHKETLKHIFPSQYLLDICANEMDKSRFSASSLKMSKAKVAETDRVHFKWEFVNDFKWNCAVDSLKSYLKKRLKDSPCVPDISVAMSAVTTYTSSMI